METDPFADIPVSGTAVADPFADIPATAAAPADPFADIPSTRAFKTPSFTDLTRSGFISQPSGSIDTPALGEHPADPAWLAAKGSVSLAPLVDTIKALATPTEHATPHTAEEVLKTIPSSGAPIIQFPKAEGDNVTAGALRGISNVASSMTSPENLAIIGSLGGAPALLQKAVAVGFGAQMAKDVPEKVSEAMDQTTVGGKSEKLTEAIAEAAMAFGSFTHIAGRSGRLPTDALSPTSLPEWVKEKTGHEINQENPSPASVDGLMLAKEKAGEGFFDLPKEQQAERTKIINEIDDQLKGMPPEAVKAGEERVVARGQSPPPVAEAAVPENTGGPPAKGGTSSLFKRAQAEAGVTPEEPPSETPPIVDPAMHQAALDSAERIATQVTSGQGDIVQRAARDAAFDKIQKNIAAGKPTMSFVRETAKEAAGKAVEKSGPSLDVENDQGKTLGASVPSEALTPVQEAAKSDMIDAVQKQVNALPADIQKTAKAFLEAAQSGDKTDLRSLGEKLGVSQTTVANHLTKMRAAFKGLKEEGYSVGPGAASISEQIKNTLEPTGLKRAVVDTERLARGAEPIPTPERQREDQVVKDAEDRLYEDPTRAKALVARIVDDGDKSISEHDAAELLVERRKVMNERNDWEDRLGKGEDVEVAKTRLTEIENELDRLDRAQRAAGTQWGRLGHMYQRMIRDDFTLEGMERKMRAAKQGPLTDVEREQLKDQNETIKKYQSELDKLRKENEDTQLDADTQHFVEATINELGKSYLEKPAYGKKVFDIARGIVDRWKDEAKTAHDDLRKALGTANAGIPNPAIVLHVAKILRAKIGEFGLNKAEAFAEMISEYGPKVKEHLEKGWRKKDELIAQEKGDSKAKEVASKGLRKKGEKTPVEAKAEAKAEAVAGEPLSHKVVYDYVKSLIESGIHGVDALMKAAHTGLKESFPELTERDVRRAFTEYGKAKFPSKDAVKVELAETRRVAQLQESIDRLKEGQEPLKSGLQRDKATQQVREKQKELNELLQKHAGPPSPERLASRDEAKQTALRNAIEDLDKQLRTGEKQAKGAPAPDSTKTEQLRAERDAMRAKLDEIEKEANPPKSPEERYNATRLKQVEKRTAELEAKTKAGDFSKPTKPLPLPKIQAVKNAEFKLAQAKKKFNEGVFDTALKNRSLTRKVLEGGRDVLNTARAAMTAFDLSAVLRQGGFISLGHPIRALKAFPAMFRALASEKGEFELNKEIQSRPNADLYKSSKLHLTDPDDSHLSKMEEAYMSRWAKKIPGVSHSERAYNGFLNRLRADSFDAMADSLGHKPTPEEAKAIANFVNVATGRGNLAGAAGAAISLNTAFFAPRYVVSRFELLAGQPLYHGTAATRIAVAKEYARFLVGIGVVYALSQAAGATVEKDPRSSDFGKLKFGKLRVDPLSGLSQVSTLLARTTTGKSKTPNGIKKIRGADLPFGQEDTAAVAGRFLRSKLSPVLGAALDASSGKTVTGQPVTPAQAFERLVIPLSFGDVYDAMKDQGIAKGTALGLLSLLGWGIQKYDDHRSSSRN